MRTRFVGYRGVVVSVLLVVGTVLGDVPAVWAWYLWATVGSAGTVDEADTNIVWLGGSEAVGLLPIGTPNHGGTVGIKSNAPLPATLNIRYNVVMGDVLGLFDAKLRVRYVDNGSGARVIVRLKQYDLDTGEISVMTDFDSNTFPQIAPVVSPINPRSGFQRQEGPCRGRWFNPNKFVYFIDAELIKTDASGEPVLGVIEVDACGS